MEGEGQDNEENVPVKLNTEVKNSIRHTFEALQLSNGRNSASGEVPKSKLQVLCASISRDLTIPYSSDDLDNYKADKKSLSCGEFVDYLEDELLPQGKNDEIHKQHKLFWTIVSQTFFKQNEHMLTEDETYKQWMMFNVLDIDETSRVHKEELGLLLEKACHAMGKVWNPTALNECSELEDLTFWQYLQCLEKHYLVDTDKSVYQEALEEIVDYVLNEVLMQGYVTKKGHMVKSTKNRWFVLKPENLCYYTNRSCTDKKGEVIININTKAAAIPDSKKYRFNVTCGDTKTNYDLEVRDQRTKQEWLVALQKAIANSGGQSVQRKERLQRRLERNEKKLAKLEEERRKREQENLLLEQQKELELLRQKYSDAEAQALVEAENLQDEIRRREELEKLHSELQQLLLAEKEAREAEAKARALQDELLLNEKKRLEEMEKMKAEKEKLLQEELKKRESLEERQKLQDKLLEEERQRLEELEKERQATEQAMREANEKLHAAEEASRRAAEEAKKKAREITTCTGLARPIGPHIPAFVTHRGIGAFCEEDFEKINKRKKVPPIVKPKPKRTAANGDDSESLETEENGSEVNDENVLENGDGDSEKAEENQGSFGDVEQEQNDEECTNDNNLDAENSEVQDGEGQADPNEQRSVEDGTTISSERREDNETPVQNQDATQEEDAVEKDGSQNQQDNIECSEESSEAKGIDSEPSDQVIKNTSAEEDKITHEDNTSSDSTEQQGDVDS
ncbi:switch-associated protein 70 [Exaiptasia diaphana]|uniref:PH domain-containing protein n=1 Tax=Exaiptasia diaphana TaxID=2652724 RepID=A0A913Y3X7_EXADI|nr:switch-associated protein 70 [Exaiptasia diaphana]KXJ28917.1 Switch-associated protein 70 [Exaiptasia diaphana]